MKDFFCLKIREAIQLKIPTIQMAESAFQTIKENEAHIGEFLPFVEVLKTIEDERAFIELKLQEMEKGTAFLAFILEEEKVIGTIDLHFIDSRAKKAEIGYWIAKEYTKKGIMKETLTKFMDYSFFKLGLNKLSIKADRMNRSSNAVARSCGFQYVGILKAEEFRYGSYHEMNLYEFLRSDWQR